MSYVPNTDADRAAMLSTIGVTSVDDLFTEIPADCRNPLLDLPSPASEIDLRREMRDLSSRNVNLDQVLSFLGAGLYYHYVPSVVGHILSRGEFATSYTPYQPEISQGVLQATYEFQSLVCSLTGMDVANASMYDGATALAEAALMAASVTGRRRIAVLRSVHPEYQDVLTTYTSVTDVELVTFEVSAGKCPVLDDSFAAVLVQQPNFFGCIEDLVGLAKSAHDVGALLVVAVDPISLGLLKPPGELGADIVVAEGQPLGNLPNFGGPLVGLFACRSEFVRHMPGRLVGATTDKNGERGFVLTLQTREQHIRRERASSNICTNEALNALAVAVYLSVMGPQGLRRVAELCLHKAHYAASRVSALPGYGLRFKAPFFKEFVVQCPRSAEQTNAALLGQGIIGGYDLGKAYPTMQDSLLVCVTELHRREDIDRLVDSLARIGRVPQGGPTK